jgi:hypothetical protein
MKNVLFWCGVEGNSYVREKYRYGDFSWMEYSKKTWEFWCKKHNIEFFHYKKSKLDDHLKFKINWQRWFDVIDLVGDFDQIMVVDASNMIKWNAPNFFDESENKWCGFLGNENLKWMYESINGYKPLFDNFQFDYNKHYLAGVTLFNKSHIQFFENFKKFYFDNLETILNYEDKIVKRGRDQPVLNYLLQINKIETKTFPISYGINHMWRRNTFINSEYSDNSLPIFINHFNVWMFSGFPDRGETRTHLMKQTWDLVKTNYE